MNCYLIENKDDGKRYVTNADTISEAEEMFMYAFQVENFTISRGDIEVLKRDETVIFF